MPVRVALNLVFLVPGQTGGMETVARELVPLLAADPRLEVTSLVNREAAAERGAPWLEVGAVEVIPVKATNRFEWVRGEQWHVPRAAARVGAGLIHSLGSTAPLTGPQVRVTTVHDLNYLVVPDAHFGLRGLGMRALVPAAARRSSRVIADSESTAADLRLRLGVPASVIDVVPLAAAAPRAAPADAASLRARLGLGERPVLFSPGATRPHKNAGILLEALALMDAGSRPVIVVSGYPTPHEDELRARAASLGLSGDLVLAGHLPAGDLEGLYALSSVVVVPSRYEGFGLPVLEAMVRGVPVVCSSSSSLPEVAGEAALLADPASTVEMAAAISRVLGDPALAERLSRAGIERARAYSWEQTAALTVESYERALGISS